MLYTTSSLYHLVPPDLINVPSTAPVLKMPEKNLQIYLLDNKKRHHPSTNRT